jgi:tripartite-type tricarboxylate transporter receptor subunit TctC
LPDLLTTAEVGYPTITASEYKSVSGPPNMPDYIVEVWDKALQEMVKDPEALAQLKNVGAFSFYRNSRDIKEYTIRETQEIKELWGLK